MCSRTLEITDIYVDLNEDWLKRSLSFIQPDFEDVIEAAVPILFNIIRHHGTYPFKPMSNNTLTPLQVANAIALLSANDTSVCYTSSQLTARKPTCDQAAQDPQYHALHIGPRDWNNRTRVLFQSMSDINWSQTSNTDRRDDEDDKDLVIVLKSALPPESKYIEDFASVAKTLPSSHSRKLDGTVSLTELGVLVAVLMNASTEHQRTEPLGMEVAIKSLLASMGDCFARAEARIGWEEFRQLIADNMV